MGEPGECPFDGWHLYLKDSWADSMKSNPRETGFLVDAVNSFIQYFEKDPSWLSNTVRLPPFFEFWRSPLTLLLVLLMRRIICFQRSVIYGSSNIGQKIDCFAHISASPRQPSSSTFSLPNPDVFPLTFLLFQ